MYGVESVRTRACEKRESGKQPYVSTPREKFAEWKTGLTRRAGYPTSCTQ